MPEAHVEPRPGQSRLIPSGLIGMFFLVLGIEFAIAKHDNNFTTPMHWDWRVIGKGATRPSRVAGRNVLIFGDSLLKFSLMPSIIEDRSGKKVYNFALHTGQTSSSYFMLDRALRAGARPSAVVLDLTPHMLMHPATVNKHLWSELLTARECFDLAGSMRDPDFFLSIMLAELFTSYKERHEIRASIMAAVRGESSSRRHQIAIFQRNWRQNDGAQLMCDSTVAPPIDVDYWANMLYSKWDPNPINLGYLDRFLKLARSHQITVFWVLPPIHPIVQTKTDESGFNESYTHFVEQVLARFPETMVVDARHSGFQADEFMDGVHLDRNGAVRLSEALGKILGNPVPSDTINQWVTLEAGQAGPVNLKIEDICQSTTYLEEKDAESRRVR